MSDDGRVVDLEAYRRLGQRLRGGSDGGHDGGMPPDELRERVGRLEVRVDAVVDAVKELGAKIDRLATKIDGLSERVATIEGQLKHIPSIWSMIAGQVVAAAAVAGIIIGAISFGVTISKTPPVPPPIIQQK